MHAAARRADAIAEAAGDRVVAHPLDITDRDAVAALAAKLTEGSLDTLVVAAGVNIPGRRLAELTPETWDHLLAVNLTGAFYLVHALLDPLREARGQVLMIGERVGQLDRPLGPGLPGDEGGDARARPWGRLRVRRRRALRRLMPAGGRRHRHPRQPARAADPRGP